MFTPKFTSLKHTNPSTKNIRDWWNYFEYAVAFHKLTKWTNRIKLGLYERLHHDIQYSGCVRSRATLCFGIKDRIIMALSSICAGSALPYILLLQWFCNKTNTINFRIRPWVIMSYFVFWCCHFSQWSIYTQTIHVCFQVDRFLLVLNNEQLAIQSDFILCWHW